MKILLIEPAYQNKYPPLGLMKISTYHKLRGDCVDFFKGCSEKLRNKKWDRIYISSLFTFYWSQTVKTIEFYKNSVKSPAHVIVGGVMASLMTEELKKETGVTVVTGLLDKPGALGFSDKLIVDHLVPDYSILEETDYKYPVSNAYFGYTTRGCPNRCGFCAVPILEPVFQNYSPLREQVEGIAGAHGEQKDLVLLDNNVLRSDKFDRIIDDILSLGFKKGARFNGRLRHVDFNQGIDARLLNQKKAKRLSEIALHSIRFAFDTPSVKKKYERAVELAAKNEIRRIGTYVLFNFNDTPADFFERLEFSIQLNQRYDVRISSFPMKFVPFLAKDRSYVGKHWNKRLLRGIQCILLATRGMVSPNPEFFHAAFGETVEDFIRIASMPEHYIIHRRKYEENKAAEWADLFYDLTPAKKKRLWTILDGGRVKQETIEKTKDENLKKILEHYVGEGTQVKTKTS